MLPEILTRNLRVLFVGTTVSEASNDLGFYYLGPNNRFWGLLEYAGITPVSVVTPQERKILLDTLKTHALTEMYKKLFFEKKEGVLAKHRIGLTDLNRRRVFSNDDEPDARPTTEDVRKFVLKVEKYQPQVVAFVSGTDVFENCFKPLYPAANRLRGKQDFTIGGSEVWLLGSTSGRAKDTEALEQVFEDIAERLGTLV
ncbi:MAG TPA: mismatch-specific DNA-glycosylase [Bacteroidota bacterium]|nr:mismatch-specific DNA-glycosylase [Bacteroidota bacterium]